MPTAHSTRWIHDVVGSFNGTTNDLTMSRYARYMLDMRSTDKYTQVPYELYTDPTTKAKATHRRAWCIVDKRDVRRFSASMPCAQARPRTPIPGHCWTPRPIGWLNLG